MNDLINTIYPIFIWVGIGLTISAVYTSLELIILIKTTERNKILLLLGGTFSMGIGIWLMNFIGLISVNITRFAHYQIALTILSLLIGLVFTGMCFFSISGDIVHYYQLVNASFLLTLAVLSVHIFGIYAMNFSFNFNLLLFLLAFVFIFGFFLISLSLLFYTKGHWGWLKPVTTLLLSSTIVEGHFLLNRAAFLTEQIFHRTNNIHSFIIYFILILSIFVLAGLISSSTIINKRLAISDASLRDIKSALDESAIVTISNANGKIVYVNDKFEEISKYRREEIIGLDHRVLNSGYHTKKFFQSMWTTIKSGQIWSGEIRNRAKNGNYYWVDTTIVPILDKAGKPNQYISIRTDITNRKKAELDLLNSMKEIRDIKFALDQSSIVAITDHHGIITYVNDKFCEISKYDRSELLRKDHRIINSGYHPKEFFQTLWKTIASGTVWKGEVCNKAKDGTLYWVDTTIVPFLNEQGKPYQYLAIRNDITERKKTEEILHRQDKLAAVGQLAAGVAHEIRNPLTSMRGYAEFLQLDEQDPERLEFLNIILQEIERVNMIVEDFMVLAKPKAVVLKEQNVVPVIQDVVCLLEFEARKKNVHLHFDCHQEIIQIECDENRLKQVFLNFIKNGIEAMPNGGDLYVRVNIQDRHVQISIQDNGVGIPQEKLKNLGEPFYTTKKNGNGLGLMVSFKIIESHNGKVYVESKPNKGTTFNILLPAKTA